jgi:Zn-dependent protease
MVTRGLRVGSVRGIDIRIDVSWLIIAALITWSYWGRITDIYGRGGKVALVMAAIAAALFFASVLVHELAHALEAQHRGIHVGGITLFLFGGVTETRFDVKRPIDEFALTAVGPFSSFVLAAGFGLAATGAREIGWSAVAEVTGLLGWVNLALGVFNLVPGAPLDGGRILRAVVWWVTGDRRRSIVVAGWAGRIVGFLLVALGIIQLLTVPGAFVGGAWLAFIGWFLARAASAEIARATVSDLLAHVPTRRLAIGADPVDADATVEELLDRWQSTDAPDVLAVGRPGGPIEGAVAFDDVRRTPRRSRVRSVMIPVDVLPSVDADDDAGAVLDALAERPIVAIREHGRVCGITTAGRLDAAVHRAQRLHGSGFAR